ncbi:MAG: hypothetical protein JO290_02395 [Sphingomonadaceae bacterium]|nr:hypothetical protein [Sphingomonadaceae bacterium]
MLRPLDLARLWRDTLADTRALLPLVWPVAGAFVLLPTVFIDLYGPPLPKTPAELTLRQVLILLVIPGLIALVAQATVIRLALDRQRGVGRSVGEALRGSLAAWPLVIAVQALSALGIAPGVMLLILPGVYVAGRLMPALPLALDGAGPVAAVERAWALTAGNGWRAVGFLLLLVGWSFLISAAAGIGGAIVVKLFAAAGAKGIGVLVASTFDGIVAALFAIVSAVATTTVYRQLQP